MVSKSHQQYEQDFYAWAIHSAQLIRAGKFSEIDIEHLAEEIESIGKSEKRELINRFAALIAHLLKWQFQPGRCSNSRKYTIKEQRLQLIELLEESPSLKHDLALKVKSIYEHARTIALRDTGLDENNLPAICPFSISQILDLEFLPNKNN
jgi:hypothetical protein